MSKQDWIISSIIAGTMVVAVAIFGTPQPLSNAIPSAHAATNAPDYLRSVYGPLHFKPAAENAKDEECLACHQEILEDRVAAKSQAGVAAKDSKAWYQGLSTYKGDQETFHRRHLTTPMAKELMNLQCNTCHQGHDPREEAPGSSANVSQDTTDITLRKQVNPETVCLKCHGQMPAKEIMGLPGPWDESKETFQNDCLLCHANIRTNRHNVTYLKADAIEAAATAGKEAKTGGDVCYGCHGGRAWYRISYPYPRHPWPDMPADTPELLKDRPGHSEPRFAKPNPTVNR